MTTLGEPVNLDDEIRLGDIADKFIRDPDVQALFERVRERIRLEWQNADQPVKRESLHAEIRGLARLEIELQSAADAGEHARRAQH